MPRVIHFEIPADDPERAVNFYRSVFGWEINNWGGPVEYWLITTGPESEMGIDGAIMRRTGGAKGDSPTAYICTVGVPTVDEYAAKVEANGGAVVTAKMAIPGVGWFAYCRDTEGNQFGIMQPDEKAA
jgi:predicted enzyme related to lactoylglutathione lyase